MRLSFLLLFVTILLTACGADPDPNIDTDASLEGRWLLEEARRDNVKTGSFDKLYFEFAPDGAFRTNLPPGEQAGRWERDGNEIVTTEVEVPLTYTIEFLDNEELNLRANYQGFLFDFALVREGVDE